MAILNAVNTKDLIFDLISCSEGPWGLVVKRQGQNEEFCCFQIDVHFLFLDNHAKQLMTSISELISYFVCHV